MEIKNVVAMSVIGLLVGCSGSGSSSDSPGQSGDYLNYGGQSYSLRTGLDVAYKPSDHHSKSELALTDGSFYQFQLIFISSFTPVWVWRARGGSVWIRGDFLSPGTTTDGLRAGTYVYQSEDVDENSQALADVFFFNDARMGVDINNDGYIESDDNEFLDVVGGTVTLTESGTRLIVEFSVQLENGVSVSGSYSGDLAHV